MRRAHRFAVFGPAGSGKTFLALERARRLAESGQRVAMLCYSRGLSRYLARVAEQWEPDERPAYIGTFHRLASLWGVKPPRDAPTEWWEVESAETLRAVAEAMPADERFDAIIVDEAQDFGAAWWPAVLAALVDPDAGGLVVFADEDQGVFDRDVSALPALTPLNLSVNLRNSEPIARCAETLASDPVDHLGVSGPEIILIDVPVDDAVSAADDAVERLMGEGWDPVDVALLTTGSRHPVQVERAGDDADAYWDSLWENDDIFYGHVLSFKGLERPVVVLALNGWKRPERARELLYVGLTRARDQLVICGPREELERLGGPALMAALLV
jgi:superfamily I DNA/RNA helicase